MPESVYSLPPFAEGCRYLNAERLGPRTAYDMDDHRVRQQRDLGPHGEYAWHYLHQFGEQAVPVRGLAHPASPTPQLRQQVEAWLGVISPSVRVDVHAVPALDSIQAEFSYPTPTGAGEPTRPTNIGFGLTYTLPIIVALLSAKPGDLLIIENPEAHVHPRGQFELARLMARAAHGGVQIIVETHSDHVLNGIRVEVAEGDLRPDELRTHWFAQAAGSREPEIISPNIDSNGCFDAWPEGFFDQWENALDMLLQRGGGRGCPST